MQFERFDQGHRRQDRINADDARRLELAVLSAGRDVVARQKRMFTELAADFIVVIQTGSYSKTQRACSAPPGLCTRPTDFVVRARPKPPNPAVVTILLPEDRIDVSLGIERRNEIISMT
ncbi:hypothetical protein M2175_003875 [Bradyrhizobium elkanii]|uniref:hypothetical protein n=1 Tax=Bradyrhizobium TaxID=374 RepID=UPI00286E275E|nr:MULTISPECIES: hypothetical protein [Bradyrhizobium]MCS3928844.1 hypothetical protein [Bradyrhizobium elkanii]MCS3969398.1 hypothetical protein [Bradyrhizobium japonicum]